MQLRDVYCNSCSVPSKIENNRDIFVDLTKAIAILLMVIGHNEFSYWFGGLPRAIIFSFHMPCFFILSGYMHRQKDMRTTLKNNAQSLLYPYLIFVILVYSLKIIGGGISFAMAVKLILSVNSAHINSVWFIKGYTVGAVWFLVALFWGKIFFSIILKYSAKWHLVWCALLSFFSIYLGQHINLPFGLLTGLSSLVFISLGYHIKTHGINMILLIVCVVLWPVSFLYSYMDMAGLNYENVALNWIGALGGTCCCYAFAMLISKISLGKRFAFFGRNSLYVLCIHYVIMKFWAFSDVTGKLYCSIFVIAPFVICFLLVRYKLLSFMFRPICCK